MVCCFYCCDYNLCFSKALLLTIVLAVPSSNILLRFVLSLERGRFVIINHCISVTMKRGALIVIEGLDRTGKSTQCKALVENLLKKQVQTEYTNFPARNTDIGKMISSYLTHERELPDEAVHLLFSANRWEKASSIIKTLESGTSIIVDRYCYSGVAFTAAKGFDFNWCKTSDAGLPQPDKVFFLTTSPEALKTRNGFGNERYENMDFQGKVSKIYNKLMDDNWEIIDASRPIAEIQEELFKKALDVIDNVGDQPIGKIWQ